MGRGKGEAARAKSRPSSSSMAASLLPSGATAVGFGGYIGSSRVDSSLPSTPEASPFLEIDGEVALHLKRLSRKDPITKLKALTSLSQLIKQKPAKEVTIIIPQWAFEYKKLLLDYNREVRRATHDTMTNIVTAIGELAPHMKLLMGPWWFSQFDSVYEVSQAAKRSFQSAFPAKERRVDALMIYAIEIFTYIEENLKLTPQSLSDKATASDELEEMHQQVISSSLRALAAILDAFFSLRSERSGSENVSDDSKHAVKARTAAVSTAEKLLSTHKYFINFLKSQSVAIRSAAYSVVGSFVKNIPHVISKGDMKELAVAILGSFQEKNPGCHSSMWETLLLFSKRFPDSWTMVNLHKTVLGRLWNFLRNGCFGSQQLSYPALVLFLETMPSKVISGEIFLEFFESLWEGRKFSYSSHADQLAFFCAIEECFIWCLANVSRYCDEDTIYDSQRSLVDKILIRLLWPEFILSASSKYEDTFSFHAFGQSKKIIEPTLEEPSETAITKHSVDYRNLGKCIIRILSGIHQLNYDLFLVFSMKFKTDYLDLFQQTEHSQNVQWVVRFLSLLDKHALLKGETWPLLNLMGPTLKKSFPLIETLDSPDAVRVIVVSVATFGARKIMQELMSIDSGTEQFLKSFNEVIIPLCLRHCIASMTARLDLLLALLDDQCFPEQWDAIIRYLVNREKVSFDPKNMDRNKIFILATLMEKVREMTWKSIHQFGSCKYDWHHELLDLVSAHVVQVFPRFGEPDTQLLCALLGGRSEDDKISFLSEKTIVLIFEELLRRLMSIFACSTFAWVQDKVALFARGESYSSKRFESSNNIQDGAHFAIDILNGSTFCLHTIEAENELIQGILSAVIIIDWEFNCMNFLKDGLNNEQMRQLEARVTFFKAVHAFHCKLSEQFLKCFGTNIRRSLRITLVQSVKCIACEDDRFDLENLISACCQWTIDVLELFCQDQEEEQQLMDQFLSRTESWPLCIPPEMMGARLENISLHGPNNTKFVALINKLISKIGFDRVVAGVIKPESASGDNPLMNLTISQIHYSRPWLAAEIMCTWKWLGGDVLHSFLPSFLSYVKKGDAAFLNSILNILLDGALVRGANAGLNFLWHATLDELDAIESPFLRALTCLLSAIFQENVWGSEEANSLFILLLDKLYIGDTANSNCLSVLPCIMNVLVRPLSTGFGDCTNDQCDTYSQSELHHATLDWLKKALSFPPLNTWQTGEDMEDWLNLVVSCFPLEVSKSMQDIKPERFISPTERTTLYELLRKQRQASSAIVNKLPVVQKLLSELSVISIAYCWEEFDDDDWKFVLHQLRFWIEAAVVMMEEFVENVNDTLKNEPDDVNVSLSKLRDIIELSDPFNMELARNGLIGFSLFCSLGFQAKEHAENLNSLGNEKWVIISDRIFEGILRLFFCTAVAEAIASSCCHEASSIIASSRLNHHEFWELVGSCVVLSSLHARDKAMKSIEIWGLSKGAVSSLFTLLFSCKPLSLLQLAAFALLSTDPVAQSAFSCDNDGMLDHSSSNNSDSFDTSSAEKFKLREEISHKLEKVPLNVLEMDLVAHERVNLLVAWSLLLSHTVSLPSSSKERERITQYVQDSADSIILDCLFQHIPLEHYMGTSSRKKDMELPSEVAAAGNAATRAITTRSLLFSVEVLWPVGPEKLASLSGAVLGLMLYSLPAYVRGWFSDVRDRSALSAIESFTKAWCSPVLISNELSQIKKASFADDNFSISVSKSANEVVATYTKDETGMDLVIRLPPSYPLRLVDVESTKSLGISEVKQRKWLMSLMAFVRIQNGALAEAIRSWKSSFDREFEGVEDCPICYSVIHSVNHSLPRLACKTCKHKFHSACLYKWFSTSHKSTCPLCQSPF
ncbi:E3 ubiquitin-protein ligase listerin isoform X2 [Andrographis paniculata]|uniref:E3 ubiquitin-protein ligase listerin isoform X2 n=1 Tax=Andrographis paniculata TaxID=175694 RepID=UPI0021E8DBF1|nr:E3 ubiquitin-protein ligase listerin isoform X2 [Andrographis paniculata]